VKRLTSLLGFSSCEGGAAALTSDAWGGSGRQEFRRADSFAGRDLCLGGREGWKLPPRAVAVCWTSLFAVRAVWRALACGSIHEPSDDGVEGVLESL